MPLSWATNLKFPSQWVVIWSLKFNMWSTKSNVRSNFGQDKWSSCLQELMWVQRPKWLLHTASFTWMIMNDTLGAQSATVAGKEGCTGKATFQRGHWDRTGLWLGNVTYSSCVLQFCTSGTVQDLSCTKPCFSCCYPLLGFTSERFTLWLRIWSLLCEKASAYMEDRVDLQWACWSTSSGQESLWHDRITLLPLKVLLCYLNWICTEQLYKKDHSSWKQQCQVMTLLWNNSFRAAVSNAVYQQQLLFLQLLKEAIRVHFSKFGRKIIFQFHL